MDFNKLLEDFARIPQVVEQAKTRGARQREIENAIDRFQPDYMEASEIISAVVGQLRARYDNNLSVDLEHIFRQLFDQLDEEDRCEEREPDEMDLARWEEERKQSQVNDANE